MNRVMVISPHPGDESIGCGGTICKHVAAGDTVHIEVLTSGEKGGRGVGEHEAALMREAEAKTAAEILKVAHIEFYRQVDGALSASEKLVHMLANRIETVR